MANINKGKRFKSKLFEHDTRIHKSANLTGLGKRSRSRFTSRIPNTLSFKSLTLVDLGFILANLPLKDI